MKLRTKFQDEDFELGEVTDADVVTLPDGRIELQAKAKAGGLHIFFYDKLEKLYSEWEDMPEEKWQDVLGFEELYQVSNFGNVRTVKNGEAEMSQQENRNGYMTVHLRDKGVERRAMVHRLVAEAFIPNPNGLRDVNHKNGDKSDNRVENLEWVSHADNMTHSFRELGKNVRHIVQLDLDNNFIERWNSIVEASEATGICRTNIGECCRGNRKHTKGYKWAYEEDYEEPKGTALNWMILKLETFIGNEPDDSLMDLEDCKQMLEKLKAWKRLKDKGFRFEGYSHYDWNGNESLAISFEYPDFDETFDNKQVVADLGLLFSGEDG